MVLGFWRRGGPIAALALMSWACSDSGGSGGGPGLDLFDDVTDEPIWTDGGDFGNDGDDTLYAVSRFAAVENPANPLSYFVSWTTDSAVATELRVDCGPEYQLTFRDQTAKSGHEVFVMGLIDGLTCDLTALPSRLTSGETTAVIEVGGLPEALPELDVTVMDTERMEPGWTLFSLAGANTERDFIIVLVDPQGRYRWLYSPGLGRSGSGTEVQVVDGGVLLGSGAPHQSIVSWEGDIAWALNRHGHHDMRLSPWNDGHVIFLGSSDENCETTEHTAIELNMETREVIWEWRVCEHWTPRRQYMNWSHLNTIEPFAGERAVLISSRDQDALFKVNRDTGDVEWTLGHEGDFEADPSVWFFRQHAPEIQPDGSILILDNGMTEAGAASSGLPREMARTWTRVIQVALTFDEDGEPDSAEIVWEYTDESIFAVNRSEADRLPNGNTLIHYVWVEPDQRLIMREVTTEGDIVWNVVTPPDHSSYRSERVAPYFGHIGFQDL